jgi:plastocyanin
MGPRFCAIARMGLLGLAVFAAPTAMAETIRVTVDNLNYTPAQVSAHVGDTVEWVNTDFLLHTATSRKKEWDISIAPSKTGHVTLTSAGEIDYYCRFHPNMAGHISVAPP